MVSPDMKEQLEATLLEIQELEKTIKKELREIEDNVSFQLREGRIVFKKDIRRIHRALKRNLFKYISQSRLLVILTAPILYLMIVPALFLDASVCIYQFICFPVYGIPKVKRAGYFPLDRHKLAYLNGVEKLNCEYCTYFNGLIAFVREVAARTEQYWCPIRHARASTGAHNRSIYFVPYGDPAAYRNKLEKIRKTLRREVMSQKTNSPPVKI
jgi:hypothetical protein